MKRNLWLASKAFASMMVDVLAGMVGLLILWGALMFWVVFLSEVINTVE